MKLMNVITFLSNLGVSTYAGNYDDSYNPLEWGSTLLDWMLALFP